MDSPIGFRESPVVDQEGRQGLQSKEDEVYEALAALTRKVPKRIQLFYSKGNVHIAAE